MYSFGCFLKSGYFKVTEYKMLYSFDFIIYIKAIGNKESKSNCFCCHIDKGSGDIECKIYPFFSFNNVVDAFFFQLTWNK